MVYWSRCERDWQGSLLMKYFLSKTTFQYSTIPCVRQKHSPQKTFLFSISCRNSDILYLIIQRDFLRRTENNSSFSPIWLVSFISEFPLMARTRFLSNEVSWILHCVSMENSHVFYRLWSVAFLFKQFRCSGILVRPWSASSASSRRAGRRAGFEPVFEN